MVTLCYALIGSMAVLDTSALVFWQDAQWWTLVALMPDPCPLVGRISNFFAPAKSSTVCTDRIATQYRLYNGRSLKKEGYACTKVIGRTISLINM
jgi:hypothetical protein